MKTLLLGSNRDLPYSFFLGRRKHIVSHREQHAASLRPQESLLPATQVPTHGKPLWEQIFAIDARWPGLYITQGTSLISEEIEETREQVNSVTGARRVQNLQDLVCAVEASLV